MNTNEKNSDNKIQTETPTLMDDVTIGRDETPPRQSLPLEPQQPSDNIFVSILRRLVAGLLVALCLTTLMLSMATFWIKNNIASTATWTDKASRLIENSAIRSSISSSLADQIFTQAAAEAVSSGQLPPTVLPDGSTRDSIKQRIDGILQSDAFKKLWININSSAHQGLSNSLSNSGQADQATLDRNIMYIDDGQLMFASRSVLASIRPILIEGGFDIASNLDATKVPEKSPLMAIGNLTTVMMFVDLFDKAAQYLPVLFLTFLIGALAISPAKRRTLLKVGWPVALFVAPLAFLPEIVQYASTAGNAPVDPSIIQAFISIFAREIADGSRIVLVVALIVVLACYANGTSRLAKYVRSIFGKIIRTNGSNNPVLYWIAKQYGYIIVAIVSAAAILLIVQMNSGLSYFVVVSSVTALLTFVVTTIRQSVLPSTVK